MLLGGGMSHFTKYQKHILKELTFRLEIFTHIVPVPAIVYYAALAILTWILHKLIKLLHNLMFLCYYMIDGEQL